MANLLLGIKIGAEGGPQTVKQIREIDDRVQKLKKTNEEVAETAAALKDAYDLSDAEVDALTKELLKVQQATEATEEKARQAAEAFEALSATEQAISQLQEALAPDQNAARLLQSLQGIVDEGGDV